MIKTVFVEVFYKETSTLFDAGGSVIPIIIGIHYLSALEAVVKMFLSVLSFLLLSTWCN
ncbi:hypothetical protein [Neobacillus drentensis]|uniref:hypothetical protein n=1 Tax=Neobacillus drentensis TaxID=220684 RepID=UPI002FFD82C5